MTKTLDGRMKIKGREARTRDRVVNNSCKDILRSVAFLCFVSSR
jgi:hypothetical protein